MLNYQFNIEEYDWDVDVYYYITHYEVNEIIDKLKHLGCKYDKLASANHYLIKNKLNTGLIYSNYKKRKSIIVISKTSTPSEFLNSVFHEVYHLISHIVDCDNIDYLSEKPAYLAGNIIQAMYLKSKDFLCECHNKNFSYEKDTNNRSVN